MSIPWSGSAISEMSVGVNVVPKERKGIGMSRRYFECLVLTALTSVFLAFAGCGDDKSAEGRADGHMHDPDGGGGDEDGGSNPSSWLHTEGNRILHDDGEPFRGRGANIHDTRSCWACAWAPPDVEEVKRRIDTLVDVWQANFVRLLLESYPDNSGGEVQWQTVTDDADYLEDVVELVNHIGTKPGVYVLLSLWVDPSFTDLGWPTADTIETWELLAGTFLWHPYVLYGLVNEPEENWDGSLDADCHSAMNATVAAIRAVESTNGAPRHIISVQGTRAWGRVLDYYIDHPITAGSGQNVVYETHVYDEISDFHDHFEVPAQTLPVIIGEYGPADGYMTLDDCLELMNRAEASGIPYLAWTFHMRCPPNLLEDPSGGCGIGMTLQPTDWGQALINRLSQPW